MTDYLHDIDDDLQIADGDFVVGESTQQHQKQLIELKKGELRQFPKTGVGIDNYLLDDNAGDVYQEIQRQFEADRMVIRKVELLLNEGLNKLETNIDAFYP